MNGFSGEPPPPGSWAESMAGAPKYHNAEIMKSTGNEKRGGINP